MPSDFGGSSSTWHKHPIVAVFVGGVAALLFVGFIFVPLITMFLPTVAGRWGNKGVL